MFYYFAPTITADSVTQPASVEAIVQPHTLDYDTGETVYGEPIQQFGPIAVAGAKYHYDSTNGRFVVKSPQLVEYSDWNTVSEVDVIAEYGEVF